MSTELYNSESPADTERRLKKQWEESDLSSAQSQELAGATSLTQIGSILFAYGGKVAEGYVFGDEIGEVQIAEWSRIKTVLESWQYLSGTGTEQDLTIYSQCVSLLDEFPGSTRRDVDRILRSYLGFKE